MPCGANMKNSKPEKYQKHDFRLYQNTQKAQIICCAKCGLRITEKEYAEGTYADEECAGRDIGNSSLAWIHGPRRR